jgi:thiamine monophosphate kinase
MQMQSDPFLGWTTIDGREYMVRQLNDHKASIQVTDLKAGLLEYASVCGELLARGHARSGDCLMLGGYLGKSARFDEAAVKFAEAYADQTERDWHELVKSMKKPGKKKYSRSVGKK